MQILPTILLILLATFGNSLPTTFDFRVQPSMIKYADFSLKQEGTCVAHSWGLQLSQVLSNAASLTFQSKIRLSSQHLIECVQNVNQICHDASLQNIHDAINFIQKQGITTVECIKNRIFGSPRDYCPRQCDNGYSFESVYKAVIKKHDTFNQTLRNLTMDQKTTGFVVVKVYNSMNYYSSQRPEHLQNTDGEVFQFRVGEIVGWRNKGEELVVRLGVGDGWGYNGFANLNMNKHKNLIEEMYTVKVAPTSRIEKAVFYEEQE